MRKRRVVGAFLMIIALIMMLLPATEADAESSVSDFLIDDGVLVKYLGTDASVYVPKTVTVIGESAFENNKKVEKITLPDSVKQIKAYAFWGCDNLWTVKLGKGLETIGDLAFTNCGGLESIELPSSVHSIGIQAFSDCSRLEDIVIPPEVTNIRDDAFDRDYLLNILCEPGSYADKYARTFYERQKNMADYSGNLPDKPYIPDDGVYIGDPDPSTSQNQEDYGQYEPYPAGELLGSTKVVGNQAVVLMQSSALPTQGGAGQEPAAESGGITETPWKISERTHYRDAGFTECVLGEDKKEIGRFAYARSGLKKITMPEGLEKIEYAAFYHCDDLLTVELPESVKEVSSKAFAHTGWVDNFLKGRDGTEGDFLISGGVLIAYRGNSAEVNVPEGVRVLAGEAFSGHGEIKKLNVPATVQYVDEDALLGCDPESIQYAGENLKDKFSDMLLEEQIHLAPLSAAPRMASRSLGEDVSVGLWGKSPLVWFCAALLFGGGFAVMVKRPY